jgi:hypothetical protein
MDLIRATLRAEGNGETGTAGTPADDVLLDRVIEHVRALNGGDLDDDLAILALAYSPGR